MHTNPRPERGVSTRNDVRVATVRRLVFSALSLATAVPAVAMAQAAGFTVPQVLSYPYSQDLVAAPTGARIAWVINERGVRNVWVAEGPTFAARRVTDYRTDDGQELTNLSFSHDGRTIVYVRGGDHDANWPAEGGLPPDPAGSAIEPKVQVWAVAFAGGPPRLLAEGDEPSISPRGDRVAFLKDHHIWAVSLDGTRPAAVLVFDRGQCSDLTWSPTGDRLAFTSNRGDHAFVGVFTSDSVPVRYLAPATARDAGPVWSADGRQIAFIRLPGAGGAPEPLLERSPRPWSVWVADAASGAGHLMYKSPTTLLGSMSQAGDGPHLTWLSGGQLAVRAEFDGWPHLYTLSDGAEPKLLTPGSFMIEDITAPQNGAYLVYNANTGSDPSDVDRRHLYRVGGDGAAPVALTKGDGLEWNPVVTGDGHTVAYLGAGVQTPPLPMVIPADGGTPRSVSGITTPADFPGNQFVVPKSVTFRAADGVVAHGQLFERLGAGRQPAIIFVHGGPPRQMLLGFHYMDYYAHGYAMNQYYANHGYVVLSVNYRLGIGYGNAFHHPAHAGFAGASEYGDVLAGRAFLETLPEVDASRVGIWGGSYGGFLTALALARNSDLFAAGVDLHGVHDWTADAFDLFGPRRERYEQGDLVAAMHVAWESSPDAAISTWRSPVLLIQGDDDRNVHFHEMVDLVRRLDAGNVPHEDLVLPGEIHGFLRHQSWLMADTTAVAFFNRTLAPRK